MPNNIPIIVKFEYFWIWNKEKYHIAFTSHFKSPFTNSNTYRLTIQQHSLYLQLQHTKICSKAQHIGQHNNPKKSNVSPHLYSCTLHTPQLEEHVILLQSSYNRTLYFLPIFCFKIVLKISTRAKYSRVTFKTQKHPKFQFKVIAKILLLKAFQPEIFFVVNILHQQVFEVKLLFQVEQPGEFVLFHGFQSQMERKNTPFNL